MTELLHITADEIPSKTFNIDIREPTFKDRLVANKRVPENSNLGYSISQLMLSMCVEKINGKPIKAHPKDPISNIRPMTTRDQQFCIAVFSGAFFLDEELVEDIKSLAEELRNQDNRESFTISADRMPNENLSITFKCPSTGNQIDLDRKYPGNNQSCGYSFEEYLFAHLITHINGEEVDASSDAMSRLYTWPNIDAEFAVSTFLQMNFIDKEIREQANTLGKKWRSRERGTKKPSKQKATTTDTEQ